MKRISRAWLLLVAASAILADAIAPYQPHEQFRELANSPPSGSHLLGTDENGRDVLSRLLHGARWSIGAGAAGALLSLGAGLAAGLAAAMAGRRVERMLLWLADLFLTLPWLYLLFGVRSMLPLDLRPEISFLAVVALIGLLGWAAPARLVRSAALEILQSGYVLAARGFGATRLHIARRHVLPALGAVLAPQFFILLSRYVLAEASLSFLGLGLGEPIPSWGAMLGSLRQSMAGAMSWWLLAPALMLALFLAASNVAFEEGNQ
ncbi:MAG: ABC transporter permease [Bryobacteraceae bacterium]|nr:ABC transporter permease [Bryobacteraceae bacterium]